MNPNAPLEPTPTPTPDPVTPMGSAPDVATGVPTPGGPKSKKGLIIGLIAGGVVLLVGLAILLFFLLGNKSASTGNSVVDAVKDAVTAPKDVVDRPDGTLELTGSVEGNTGISSQDITAKTGQQVNFSNGASFMVSKVERKFTGFDPKYITVKAGEEVIAVTIVAGSRNTNGTSISKNGLTLSAPSSDKITYEFASNLAKVEGLFDSASDLKQGEQVSGKLLWIVKTGETPLALNYNASYKNYSTDEVVTLKATINL